jgi:hypothetical protein
MSANGGWTLVQHSCCAVGLTVAVGLGLNITHSTAPAAATITSEQPAAPRARTLTMSAAESCGRPHGSFVPEA